MKKSRIEEKRMKIVICDDSKDDLEQTLPECLDDILREDDIIYIETSRHKNVFYTAGQTYSIDKKMDELEAELAGRGFVRIHQSFLINMRYVGKLSSYVMVLTTGKVISVPKSRYPEVKRQYTLFKGRSDYGSMGDLFYTCHGNMGKPFFF